jgi:dihydroorotase
MPTNVSHLSITQPDDWHLHLRDGAALPMTVAATARCFRRAIVMPNLKPPVTTVADAADYRQRILAAAPVGTSFEPLMTLYLTDNMATEEIHRASEVSWLPAAKLYPAGATTNSDSGVTDVNNIMPVLEAMAERGMLLLVHGEVTDAEIDIFDREKRFIDTVLAPLQQRLPSLKIVFEHITTADAVDFVRSAGANVAATITVHHLLYNRNDMLAGGIRPHYYCLPILKRNSHQQALIDAAISGDPGFFLGTDSAPHTRHAKETACGCAGVYSAPAAIELYAEVFDQAGALEKLEGFASHFGPDFYQLPRNRDSLQLVREDWAMPETLPFAGEQVVPIAAGQQLRWRLQQEPGVSDEESSQ